MHPRNPTDGAVVFDVVRGVFFSFGWAGFIHGSVLVVEITRHP